MQAPGDYPHGIQSLCSLPCNGGLVSQSRLNIPISLGAQATKSRLSSEHDSDLSLDDGRIQAGLAAPHHTWHLPSARLPGTVRWSEQGHKTLMRYVQTLMRTCWSITSWRTGAMRTTGVTLTTIRRSWSLQGRKPWWRSRFLRLRSKWDPLWAGFWVSEAFSAHYTFKMYFFFLYSGVGSIIIIIFYVLGMGFKLYKIWKGEYVEEEPVFLKYKWKENYWKPDFQFWGSYFEGCMYEYKLNGWRNGIKSV